MMHDRLMSPILFKTCFAFKVFQFLFCFFLYQCSAVSFGMVQNDRMKKGSNIEGNIYFRTSTLKKKDFICSETFQKSPFQTQLKMIYLNSTLNFRIPLVLVFQLEVYYKVERLLKLF